MTQKNIDIMDRIVDELAAGKKISKALEVVYNKRNIAIPYCEEAFAMPTPLLGLSVRSYNALMNAGLKTINDIVKYASTHPGFVGIRNFGKTSGIEVLEIILDFAWERMNKQQRKDFLIDTVIRNQFNVRAELM